jgi:hypothetical protein
MRKIFLLIFFCLAQISFVFSQTTKDRSSISISVGAAMPTGQFSSTDLLDSKSGFAKIGEEVSISYSTPLTKGWSFIAHVQGQRNPLNTNAFESSFSQAKIYQGFYFGTGLNNPPPQTSYKIYPNWKFEKKSWLYGALLLGGQRQFSVDKSDGFNFFAKIMVGAIYAKSPKLNGSSITDTATAHIEQSKSSAFGFVYSFGGGLNYNLPKTFFLTSTVAYCETNQMKFKDVKATLTATKGTFGSPEYSVGQSTTTGNGKQIISSINISVGIGIRL